MTKLANKKNKKYWSARVTKNSHAISIPEGLFTWPAKDIALGLKRAALKSSSTKGTKFQSAMSLLNFYINRAGKNLSEQDKKRLEDAKIELRKVFKKI